MDLPSDYDRIGGEPALRAVVHTFVDRLFGDFIVGFLFEGRDRARIRLHEFELASRHLGGPHRYEGRPIGALHRPLRINRGQFRRRLGLLRTVLRECSVPEEVIERWVEHDRRLEAVITDGTDCLPDPTA